MADNDDAAMWREHRQRQQARHWENYQRNLDVLAASGIPFVLRETSCLFRQDGKPKVDFFPHTGRWRTVGMKSPQSSRPMSGGAEAFLIWYARQGATNGRE
jgi:hypothetical protein